MKIAFQSEPVSKARVTIPIREFSFATYPVRIQHNLPCFTKPGTRQNKPFKPWLSRILQALAGIVCQSVPVAGFQNRWRVAGPTRADKTLNNLRIVEDDAFASVWTARALAARVFIGCQHPRSSWITDRLPVALWPKALKTEIQQAGFAKPASVEVFAI
jgi:hypothetical protein